MKKLLIIFAMFAVLITASPIALNALNVNAVEPPAEQGEQEGPPFFKLYFMIPNNMPARMIFGTLCLAEFEKIGISTEYTYVPWGIISPRRTDPGMGKIYVDGGYDVYYERWYYGSVTPHPETMFGSWNIPPAGVNYYYMNYPDLDEVLHAYMTTYDPEEHLKLADQFSHLWQENEYFGIIYYSEDVIALSAELEGWTGTTFAGSWWPKPEDWTTTKVDPVTGKNWAAFACWGEPDTLLEIYSTGYHCSNAIDVCYDPLMGLKDWAEKEFENNLLESYEVSEDGLNWVIHLREGVKWHDGWPFNATDVDFTWRLVMDERYAALDRSSFEAVFGSTDAWEIVDEYTIEINLPEWNTLFTDTVLPYMIMPWHAYKETPGPGPGIAPEDFRSHTINTWLGTYEIRNYEDPDGPPYVAHGALGTGPWICDGFDAEGRKYVYHKNPDYHMPTEGNVEIYYHVLINGNSAMLAAMKTGEIDAADPMYSIEGLVGTIDPSWGKVYTADSYKWQHVCYNHNHPVIGTGEDTPLGKADPTRAAEAAKYVRIAMSHAIPRQKIVDEVVFGYGVPGTVPIPFTCPEYNHTWLDDDVKEYSIDLAKEYMEKAGYVYEAAPTPTPTPGPTPEPTPTPTPSFWDQYGLTVTSVLVVIIVIVIAAAFYLRR